MDNLAFKTDNVLNQQETEEPPVQVIIFEDCLDIDKKINDSVCLPTAAIPNDSKTELKPELKVHEVEKSQGQGVERKCWQRFLGMFLMLIASTCFSLNVAIVKSFKGYQVFSFSMWMMFGGCFLQSIWVLIYLQFIKKSRPFRAIYPLNDKVKQRTFLILCGRTLIGSASLVLQYCALQHLTISDTTVICFSTPVFVTFLACIVLGESFGLMNIVAVLVTLLGVAIITRPPFLTGEREMDANVLMGVGFALASMTSAAFVFVSLRLLKHVNFAVVTFSFGLVGVVTCYILSEIFGEFELPRSLWDLFMAAMTGLLTFTGQVVMTAAFKLEDAGPLSLMRSFDVVFSFIWQAIFYSVEPDKYSILGALVVLSGVILIGIRKHVSSLPKDHSCRKLCCLILK